LPSSSLQPCEVRLDHSRQRLAEQTSAHAAAPVD
jgi:hypothetical protein